MNITAGTDISDGGPRQNNLLSENSQTHITNKNGDNALLTIKICFCNDSLTVLGTYIPPGTTWGLWSRAL